MDAQIALTISGIFLTIGFGAWALVLEYRKRKPARICYVHGGLAPLFEEVVTDLPQVHISFQGRSISGRAAVLRGAFQNCGHRDLEAKMVVSPLTIRLISGFRWLDVSGITASPRLLPHVAIQHDSETAAISFGPLFRRGEWLAFSALLGMDTDKLVEFPLSFEHRIADLRPIERAKAPVRWWLRFLIFFGIALPANLALVDPRIFPRIAPRIRGWMAAVANDPRIVALEHFSKVHEQGLKFLLYLYFAGQLGLSVYFVYKLLQRPDPGLPPERRPDPGLPREFRGT
jgi:hypothetical protein